MISTALSVKVTSRMTPNKIHNVDWTLSADPIEVHLRDGLSKIGKRSERGKLLITPLNCDHLGQRFLRVHFPLPRLRCTVRLDFHPHLDWKVMHRASTRYTKRSSSTKPKQGSGQYPDTLQVGEGDLRRKILQRTHSIALRSASNSPTTTASSSSMNKSRSPGLESYYMPGFLSPPRRPPSLLPPSPSGGHSPFSGPLTSSALENHHQSPFYPSPKQASTSPAPASKEREDVDITDYYSESIRMRGLYATPFGDLQKSSLSPSGTTICEETQSVKDLDFGLQMLLGRHLFGTNGIPVIHRGQDRNSLNATFGGKSYVHPSDGDIGAGLPIDSDSDRQQGVNFSMSVGDAGTNDNASVDGPDIESGFSTTHAQCLSSGAVKPSRNVAEERCPPADNRDITNPPWFALDSPHEADICDVELTSLSPRVGCDHTFMNFTPPHVFDAFPPIRPPPCRIRTVSQLPVSMF